MRWLITFGERRWHFPCDFQWQHFLRCTDSLSHLKLFGLLPQSISAVTAGCAATQWNPVPIYLGLPQEPQVLTQAAQHGRSYSSAAADLGLLPAVPPAPKAPRISLACPDLQQSLDRWKWLTLKSLGEADSLWVRGSLQQHPPCSVFVCPEPGASSAL